MKCFEEIIRAYHSLGRIALFAVSVLLEVSLPAATVKSISVQSPSMGKGIPVSVILPADYDNPALIEKRWAVVYVLHGANGDNVEQSGPLEQNCADQFGVIIVAPDGARTSWWLDSPIDPSMRYETFVVNELVPYVDGSYRTVSARRKRAILGGSMGGYGACRLGFRHFDVFGAVGNIYGGVDFWDFPEKWDIKLRLGDRSKHPENWRKYAAVFEAGKLRNGDIELITVVGTGDFFLSCNRLMHDLLSANGVRHTYIEYRGNDDKESGHSLEFYEYALPLELKFISNYFATGKGDLADPGGIPRGKLL